MTLGARVGVLRWIAKSLCSTNRFPKNAPKGFIGEAVRFPNFLQPDRSPRTEQNSLYKHGQSSWCAKKCLHFLMPIQHPHYEI